MKKLTTKTLAFIVISALLKGLLGVFAIAENVVHEALVVISDGTQLYVFAVELSDVDGDGAVTINDALIKAHDDNYEGGSAAGYGSSVTQYGLGMTKLWGIENGGSYGYFVNDNAAFALTDPVEDDDFIYAFVYTDTTYFSDAYSFFDTKLAPLSGSGAVALSAS